MDDPTLMTAAEAAEMLAKTMNEIEAEGFLLYPHPRPIGISIRKPREHIMAVTHPDQTVVLAVVWDEGDGKGWRLKA